jgi:diketogulonate reductase-like aldo/keto reductase
METLLASGKCRAIGVSNFEARHLEDLSTCAVVPAVNQIEFNPHQQQRNLVAACRSNGIVVQGYCPLGKGRCLQDPTVTAIAKKHGCSTAQALIRFSLQSGVVCIPKSNNAKHIQENVVVGLGLDEKITLDDADMRALEGLDCGLRVTWDPSSVP